MLTEDDVVEAVCRHLEQNHYRIDSRCSTKERGEDIVAVHEAGGFTLRIEAKGETSNQAGSSRYGKPFSGTQCRDHVANALYAAAAMLAVEGSPDRVGIALADTRHHRRFIDRIDAALRRLEVLVFWVQQDHSVMKDQRYLGEAEATR